MPLKNKEYFEELFKHKAGSVDEIEELLQNLHDNLTDYSKVPFSFNDFLFQLNRRPELVLRDAYQIFSDMVAYYTKRVTRNKTSVKQNFVKYDMHNLFAKDCEVPFFADMLFANHFMEKTNAMRKGVQTNRVYLFEGPPGSGKSTFLNNLINKLENYTHQPQGIILKTVWHLDLEKISKQKTGFWDRIESIAQEYNNQDMLDAINNRKNIIYTEKYFDISCPYNDHPILQIPKEYRKQFLSTIIKSENFKEKLFSDPQYAWVFKEEPCHICSSVYDSLYDVLKSPVEILQMLYAKIFTYSRKFGEGVSVFNPGDEICRNKIENPNIQNTIQQIFNNDRIKYIFSPMAYTNNGVYAIMDLKENNVERFKKLHGIISDGIHKVSVMEEKIRTIFLGLVNPEDKKHFSDVKSFQDRIITIKIPYILDYRIIIKIYKHRFGKIAKYFMPLVLESFAKIIVSTRLEKNKEVLKSWLDKPEIYDFIDEHMMLLKMEIFSGNIPEWLSDKDKTTLSKKTVGEISTISGKEGLFGISGRKSLSLFNHFFSKYSVKQKYIDISQVIDFFTNVVDDEIKNLIPDNFLKYLHYYYDFTLMQQIKECIYFYNREQIAKDIANYLYAINFDIGTEINCPYTGDKFIVDDDFLKNFEAIFLGTVIKAGERKIFRDKNQKEYVSETLAQEINVQALDIRQTTQFKRLFSDYTTNLKQNALAPHIGNENFRRAILDYGTKDFKKYDVRLKSDIERLLKNMKKRYGYTKKNAIKAIIYIIDKK